MMGQQQTVAGNALRHIVSLVAVAALIAVMAMFALAGPASAAGNQFAKGQNDTNPGYYNNDRVGDEANEACEVRGNCRSDANNGGGVGNN
jgi:hypothetical protein